VVRLSKHRGEKPPPLYEVRELTLEEALLVLAAEKEERRIRAEERADRHAGRRSGPGGGRGER
jgi:hypothetical protein